MSKSINEPHRPIISDFKMTEAMFMSFSQRGGWNADRENLSEQEIDGLIDCFSHDLIWEEKKLRVYLNHIFGNFFREILAARIFAASKKFPGRPKFIRDQLIALIRLLEKDTDVDEICNATENALSDLYEQNEGRIVLYFLDFLAGQFPPKHYPKSLAIRRHGLTSSNVVKFKELVVYAKEVAAQNVKRGGNGDPYYKQMCVALLALYYDATGDVPRRHYDHAQETDTGPLHCLTETLLELIEAHMPDQYRVPKRKFPRMCRDVINDLKAELALKTA